MATYQNTVKSYIMMNVNTITNCWCPIKNSKCYEKQHTIKLSYIDQTENRKKIDQSIAPNWGCNSTEIHAFFVYLSFEPRPCASTICFNLTRLINPLRLINIW